LYGEEKDEKMNFEANFVKKDAKSNGITECKNSFFEDPLPGVSKACFCLDHSSYDEVIEGEFY
jgi:hypothetical protein